MKICDHIKLYAVNGSKNAGNGSGEVIHVKVPTYARVLLITAAICEQVFK